MHMNDIVKTLIGGAIVLVIGGTAYTVSQADITNKFAEETGMSQSEAEDYVNNTQDELAPWGEIGKELVDDGNGILSDAATIDCVNYMYDWESDALSCDAGKQQWTDVGNKEIALGTCYNALDTDLGSGAEAKMRECIGLIDAMNASYEHPIVQALDEGGSIAESKKTNLYNKSVLRAALESNQ